MRHALPSKVRAWTAEPLPVDVVLALERLAALEDVERIAVMPDVHLAEDVCVGTCVATRSLLLPAAVGGDIGCGMAAIAFDGAADALSEARPAAAILAGLYERIPAIRHERGMAPEYPASLAKLSLSDDALERLRKREGQWEFSTLGRGNHFVELQADEEGRLWLMLHSGSRAIGQAIRDHHVEAAVERTTGFATIAASSDEGRAYLNDMDWALAYAEASRRAMVVAATEVVHKVLGMQADWASLVTCQHNHVRRAEHVGRQLWVHRKGAISAQFDEPGIIPGSMGSESFIVAGRGDPESLCSSSHGAGRTMSRTDARRAISVRQLDREMRGIWFDHRLAARLRDEAPSAYKDVRSVMRAQQPLTRIVRRLRPLLSYKGA